MSACRGVLVVVTEYGEYYVSREEGTRFEREHADEPGSYVQPYEGEPRWEPGWQKKLLEHATAVMRKEYEGQPQ